MTNFYDWSETAAINGAADETINFAEFQNPDTVNDSARAMMARLAAWRKDNAPTRSSTGSSNAYAVTSQAGGSTSYADGELVSFIADRANTGACTLNVNSRGAVAFRPAVGVAFSANEIQANQPIIAFYRSSSNEWLAVGSGYHVTAMTAGALTQSIAARLIKIGQPVLSLAPSPNTGYIRLTEATQTLNKSDWPELSSYLSGISYPWGSTSTTFSLPPAAGYVLRFAATSSTIDTSGARTAGSTQDDQTLAHTHTFTGSGTTTTDGAHTHTVSGTTGSVSVTAGGSSPPPSAGTVTTSSNGSHSHTVTVSGTTASTGGDEVRVKNVAMHVDVFASSQLSAGTIGMFGWPFVWDTGTTAADPGTARVRGNSGTLASITTLYINETDSWGVNIGPLIGSFVEGNTIRLSKIGAQANTLVLQISGAPADAGTYRSIPVTVLVSNGSFSSGDTMALELTGGAGSDGAPGITVPDIAGLSAIGALASADKFIVYDDSATAHKSITKTRMLPEINAKRDHAAAGDGSTDDTAALQAAITAAAGNRLRIPAGTYMIGAAGLDGASNIEIVGDGPGVTVLKLSTTPSTHLLEFHTLSKIRISNLTIDFNSQSGTSYAALSMTGVDQFWIDNCRIINFDKYGIAGTKVTNGGITRCYFRRAAVVNTSNSSIVTSSGSGTESYNILIDGNYAENSSFSMNMARSTISNNIIRYFSSGGGIFFEQNATYCNTNVVIGNIISDAPTADSLGYNCTGIEGWSPRTVIANNTIYGMAGSGIDVGAQDCTVVGNVCFNNGVISGHGIMMRYSDATYNGSYATVSGNRCWDTSGAGGTQLYGYCEESASLTGIELGSNSLVGNKTGEAYMLSSTTRRYPSVIGTTTDNVGVRFDGTTGRFIQGGPISWDDSGNISGLASATFNNTGLKLRDTNASHNLTIAPGSDLTADRTLTITTGDADRTLTISASATVSQDYSTSGTPQFTGIELSHASANTLTGSGGDAFIEGNRLFRAGGTDVPVADGGTGLSSGTSGGVPYFSSTTTIASSGALTANAVVKGGGAGAAPVASGVSIDSSNNVTGVAQLRVGAGICRSGTAVTSDIGLYSEPASGWCRIAVNSGDIRMFVDGASGNNYTGTTAAFIITSAAAVQFPGITTTASAANAYLDNGASNNLLRSTSSIRYKKDIEDAELKFARNTVLRARVVHYRSDTRLCPSDNPAHGFYGLIAEEMAEIEPRLVNYTYPEGSFEDFEESYDETVKEIVSDEAGEPRIVEKVIKRTRINRRLKEGAVKNVPDGVQYERLGVLNTVVIQDHEARLVALEGGAPRPVKLSDDGSVSIRVKAALADITPEATLPQIASALVALKAALA